MAIKHDGLSVTTVAVSLTKRVADSGQPNVSSIGNIPTRSIMITNEGTASVFLGGVGLTATSYGVQLGSGERISLDLLPSEDLWAVAQSGSQQLRILHTGV